jgi:co-chaperonin GroES (HSP10)
MNWKPMGDQVLLKVEKKTEKTKSGIILVDRDMAFVLGTVVATGDGLFTQTGARIPMTDEHFMLVRESEIAVVND